MMKSRFQLLDAWRTAAIFCMCIYHFLFDLYIFGAMDGAQLFSPPLHLFQQCICWSFILLAGASARFSRNNLRHGLIVLAAHVVTVIGAAVGGQTIRFGVLALLGCSMILYHFLGRYVEKLPGWLLAGGGLGLWFLTKWWTGQTQVSVTWLYPLGFMGPGFFSEDYFPLLPWFFLFLAGTALGGVCLAHRDHPLLHLELPGWLTWPGRHSLIIYLLHQPVLYAAAYFIWGR